MTQIRKQTVLTDELELELNNRSDPDWSFEVREMTCMEEDCDCELVGVCWFNPLIEESFVKVWPAEEVRSRRKSMGNFAQSIIDKLDGITGWCHPPPCDGDCKECDDCDDCDDYED